MTKKVVLVTGASSGIGQAIAKRLLADGNTVYAAARRIDRMEGLRDGGAQLVSLDVTDGASVIRAVERIRKECGKLDILVNNAGYGSYGALEDVPMAEARRQFDVNLFGAARMIQLVVPMMREQNSGKIVNISSVGGKIWEPFGSWYHASKFAIEGLSDCLRVELGPFGIEVIVIEPGVIRTEWNEIAADSLRQTSGQTAYGPFARQYADAALTKAYSGRSASPPETVANGVSAALSAAKPKTRYAVGGGAGIVLFINRLLSDRLFDRMMWAQAKPRA